MDNESKKDEKGLNKGVGRVISNIISISIGIALGLMLFSLVGCHMEAIPNLEDLVDVPGISDTDTPTTTPNDEEDDNNDDVVVTPSEDPVIEYVDIPTGWKVDKNGDYSKLEYKEALEVFNNIIVYCRDSQGKTITIRKGSSVPITSVDDISAVFADSKITLTIRDLTIELIKK